MRLLLCIAALHNDVATLSDTKKRLRDIRLLLERRTIDHAERTLASV
jgi:hypothetical protein